jgi:hypothetical protein
MTDKPKIEVGQTWITYSGATVRILADTAQGDFPFVGQFDVHEVSLWDGNGNQAETGEDGDLTLASDGIDNLSHLAPQTIKREVALYRDRNNFVRAFEMSMQPGFHWKPISEPLTIEFTLLPGESADA